jgi:hypothetical protein
MAFQNVCYGKPSSLARELIVSGSNALQGKFSWPRIGGRMEMARVVLEALG